MSSTHVSHADERDAPLTQALLAAFRTHKTGDAAHNVVCAVKALELILGDLDVPATKLYAGGSLAEIVAAARIGGTASRAMHGVDVWDADRKAVEIKTSTTALGTRASLMLMLPAMAAGEAVADYHARMHRHLVALGDIRFTHQHSPDASCVYHLRAAFVAFYLRVRNIHGTRQAPKKVNLGGHGCERCGTVHRVMQLVAYERAWLAAGGNAAAEAAYDWDAAFRMPVPGACTAAEAWTPQPPVKAEKKK